VPAATGSRLLALGLLLLAGLLPGCGGGGEGESPPTDATLLLDFTPNAVHAGIYSAALRGFDTAEGVRLHIRKPSSSTDAVRLLGAGRTDLAVLDIHDLGLARERGEDLVGVMALVQRPLAAVLAEPGIRSPRDLEGRRAGVTGLPSDRAVLRSVVRGAGGRPDRVEEVTIGFNAVSSILGGRVSAATAFWNVEGIALERRRPGVRAFRVDEFGAPAYPELVLVVTRETLERRRAMVGAAVRGMRRGYERALEDPEGSISDLIEREPGLDRDELRAQMEAVSPAFTPPGGGGVGRLDPERLRAWARWDVEFGILRRRPDVARAFDPGLVP
jgi:putative hydroxymethylpyrimidine transport system substrate-binding protein